MADYICYGCGESGRSEREQSGDGIVEVENVPETCRKNHCGDGNTEEYRGGSDGSPFDRFGFHRGAGEGF